MVRFKILARKWHFFKKGKVRSKIIPAVEYAKYSEADFSTLQKFEDLKSFVFFGIVSESNHEFQWIFNCSSFENHVWNNHMLYFEGVVRSWSENDPYLLNKFQFSSTRFHHGTSMSSSSPFSADVGGQRCTDFVRIYCAVSVIRNLKFSVARVFEFWIWT